MCALSQCRDTEKTEQAYYRDHAQGGGAIQDALTHQANAVEWVVGPTTRLFCDAAHQALEGVEARAVSLFVPHTTAGILVQAQGPSATAVAADVETALERLVDESAAWQHVHEGDRNPWAHIRTALTASSLTIPVQAGALQLGDRQAVFLAEFDGPRTRRVCVTVL